MSFTEADKLRRSMVGMAAACGVFAVGVAVCVGARLVPKELALTVLPFAEMSDHIYDKVGCSASNCHAEDRRRHPSANVLALNWEEILNSSVSPQQMQINHRLLRLDNRGRLRDSDVSDTGFNAALYENTKTRRLTLVFEGTSNFEFERSGGKSSDFSHANTINAVPGGNGAKTHYEIAAALVNTLLELGHPTYDITGHSLGGSLAQYASILSGNNAFVFNSAALNCQLLSCPEGAVANVLRIETIGFDKANFATTILSRLKGKQFGGVVFAGYGRHDMSNVIAALRRRID